MIDERRPFQAMLHDGTFSNLDFQPGRDVVGCGCTVEMSVLRQQYRELLRQQGRDQDQADRVKGAIVLMTQQFLVMGLNRPVVLQDRGQNERAWGQVAKLSRAHVGQRVGGPPGRRTPESPPPRRPSPAPAVPRLAEVAALADRIGAELDRQKKQQGRR